MDNPQYLSMIALRSLSTTSFKPYYKWITLNTLKTVVAQLTDNSRFKPYYKWITLNT